MKKKIPELWKYCISCSKSLAKRKLALPRLFCDKCWTKHHKHFKNLLENVYTYNFCESCGKQYHGKYNDPKHLSKNNFPVI